jgi:integrase
MAEMGVPMRAISLYLGHTNEKTTEAVYAQHTPDYLKAAAAALTRQS